MYLNGKDKTTYNFNKGSDIFYMTILHTFMYILSEDLYNLINVYPAQDIYIS
jgi:hypothetical protein